MPGDRCPTCGREAKRSHAQNAYLWHVYTVIATHTGHSTEEIHQAMKYRFLPRHFVTVDGQESPVTKSTTRLTVAEFSDYVRRVESFAQQELGIELPGRSET